MFASFYPLLFSDLGWCGWRGGWVAGCLFQVLSLFPPPSFIISWSWWVLFFPASAFFFFFFFFVVFFQRVMVYLFLSGLFALNFSHTFLRPLLSHLAEKLFFLRVSVAALGDRTYTPSFFFFLGFFCGACFFPSVQVGSFVASQKSLGGSSLLALLLVTNRRVVPPFSRAASRRSPFGLGPT